MLDAGNLGGTILLLVLTAVCNITGLLGMVVYLSSMRHDPVWSRPASVSWRPRRATAFSAATILVVAAIQVAFLRLYSPMSVSTAIITVLLVIECVVFLLPFVLLLYNVAMIGRKRRTQ